jgi:YkoY family integral membrane protein
MFEQTFDLVDVPKLAILAFLEILLSADNAVVLSLLTRLLPEAERKKALWIGVASSFLFRAIAILFLSFLLQYLWLQVVGGMYLVFLAVRHFYKANKKQLVPHASFWKTVLYIELFDIAFAIDSIVAAVAFITNQSVMQNGFHPKLWIVYVGGMLGLIAVRYAADLMSRVIDRFPRLETSAYLMIAWIGLKLMVSWTWGDLPGFALIFWSVLVGLLVSGCWKRKS